MCGRGLHHTLCNGRDPSCTGYGTKVTVLTRAPKPECLVGAAGPRISGAESLATESCVGAVVGELGASVGLGVETQLPGDPFPTTALAEASEKRSSGLALSSTRPEA